MISRDAIVSEARTWLHTPWQHQCRLKGVGVDCVGLIIGVAREVGALPIDYDVRNYARNPLRDSLRAECATRMVTLRPAEAREGDVLLLSFTNWPGHLALLTDPNHIIHAHMPNGRVVEHIMNNWWRRHVVGAYQIPGVAA